MTKYLIDAEDIEDAVDIAVAFQTTFAQRGPGLRNGVVYKSHLGYYYIAHWTKTRSVVVRQEEIEEVVS